MMKRLSAILVVLCAVVHLAAACGGNGSDGPDFKTKLNGRWRDPETGVSYQFDEDGTGYYGVSQTQYQWLSDTQIEIETVAGKVVFDVSFEGENLVLTWESGGTQITQTFERQSE